MLPPAVEEAAAAVAADRQSGATRLAEQALRAFDLLAVSNPTDPAAAKELAQKLEEAQPAMSSVRNVARLAAKALADAPREWPAFRDSMQRRLAEGRRLAGQNFVDLLKRPATALTLSRSANVFECLAHAHRQGLLREAFVLESRPLEEGREFVEDLRAVGVPATVIADEAAGTFVSRVTLGLAGADTVLADGSVVNRSGTYALAALCRVAGKPFYVVCETFKIDTTRGSDTWSAPLERGPREADVDMPAWSPIFDLTPAALVTGIVTELGVLKPEQVRSVAGS